MRSAINASTKHTVGGVPECSWLCAATISRKNDTQKICGGLGFITDFNNTDIDFMTLGSSSLNYVGCVFKGVSDRTLPGAATSSEHMTIEFCEQFTRKGNNGAGYKYAGMEVGSQSYVGDTLVPPGSVLNNTSSPPSTQSSMQCPWNNSQIYGGPSVFFRLYQARLHCELCGQNPHWRPRCQGLLDRPSEL